MIAICAVAGLVGCAEERVDWVAWLGRWEPSEPVVAKVGSFRISESQVLAGDRAGELERAVERAVVAQQPGLEVDRAALEFARRRAMVAALLEDEAQRLSQSEPTPEELDEARRKVWRPAGHEITTTLILGPEGMAPEELAPLEEKAKEAAAQFLAVHGSSGLAERMRQHPPQVEPPLQVVTLSGTALAAGESPGQAPEDWFRFGTLAPALPPIPAGNYARQPLKVARGWAIAFKHYDLPRSPTTPQELEMKAHQEAVSSRVSTGVAARVDVALGNAEVEIYPDVAKERFALYQ